MSTEWSPLVSIDTGDGVSAKSRILLTDYRPTYRQSVDRQVDRVSTTLDRYVGRVSIAGIDRHSTTGAFRTHDPAFLYKRKWPYMAIFEPWRNSFRTHEGFVEVFD